MSQSDAGNPQPWILYLIRTARGSLYCGVTNDVERRFREHAADGPKTAKALRGRGPLTLAFTYPVGEKRTAMQWEWRVKRWPKARKEALIRGEISLLMLAEAEKQES